MKSKASLEAITFSACCAASPAGSAAGDMTPAQRQQAQLYNQMIAAQNAIWKRAAERCRDARDAHAVFSRKLKQGDNIADADMQKAFDKAVDK